jgi:hypothetical protein
MFQPHSLFWHYLWVAPDLFLLALAVLMWKRGLHRVFPAFFCYAMFEAIGGGAIYAIDVTPSVFSDTAYWRSYFLYQLVETLIKFAVLGEIFVHLLRQYTPLGRLARVLASAVGAMLVLTATAIAAYSHPTLSVLVAATRILGRSVSVVQCGLILFLFVFAAHFHLRWARPVFGITLGFGIIASVSVAHWAFLTNWFFGPKTFLLDFLNMITYHLCVLVWFYYLLVPQKKPTTSAVPLPENNLAIWNRELERLLQQ